MRRLIAMTCFTAGLGVALFALLWLILAENGILLKPSNPSQAVLVTMLYGALILVTFDRASSRSWPAVLRASQTRIKAARWMLGIAVLVVVAAIALLVIACLIDNQTLVDAAFYPALSTLLFASGVYIAIHWAFRPSSVLGTDVSNLNPLRLMLVRAVRSLRRSDRSRPNG